MAEKKGHPMASHELSMLYHLKGVLYEDGLGVQQDYSEAAKWYRKAAKRGHACAKHRLGLMYEYSRGVPQDYVEAANWYRKAAEVGNPDGQFSLGLMYEFGRGVPQDYSEALKWYRNLANQGIAIAQAKLGQMYWDGKGVPQDYTEAVNWNRKAAEQGNASAQHNLGLMYAKGIGLSQDYVQAHKWFNLSASRSQGEDYKKTVSNRDLAEKRMTPAGVAEAQKLAREWRKSCHSKIEMALYIPHRCPKCFESVTLIQPQHKGGAFKGPAKRMHWPEANDHSL